LSPAIAQTIVDLGIDVGDVHTTGNLRDALRQAFIKVGLNVADS
jgi:rsbT co-antagonist protein RsbR